MPIEVPISCFNTRFRMSKKLLVMKNKMASIKVSLVMYLLPQLFDIHSIDVFKKPMRFRVFDLKTKFLTSMKTLIRRLWKIAVYNVLKSKVELLLIFFLVIFY